MLCLLEELNREIILFLVEESYRCQEWPFEVIKQAAVNMEPINVNIY